MRKKINRKKNIYSAEFCVCNKCGGKHYKKKKK